MSESNADRAMPLIVVKSQGGFYDDDAYIAGYEAALIDAQLAYQPKPLLTSKTIRAHNVKQVDLIAMRYNYILNVIGVLADVEGRVDDTWVVVELIPATDEEKLL